MWDLQHKTQEEEVQLQISKHGSDVHLLLVSKLCKFVSGDGCSEYQSLLLK